MESKPHYIDHRKRLRNRFMQQGLEALYDYEVIEILLTFAIPRRDVKPIAKNLLKKFGSLKAIFEADEEELKTVLYVKDNAVELIRFIKEVSILYMKQKSMEVPVDFSNERLIKYCIEKIGNKTDEEFRVIYLDSKYSIIGDDAISEGTMDKINVYPRKVMELALKNKAYALVFTHNHPNQNVQPSEQDIKLTKALILAAKSVGISVFDHLIVSQNSHFSFREEGLI